VTIADFAGAREHGVTFSSGDAGRAVHALAEIGELIESGRFSLPVAQTFRLADIAEAHRVGEDGHVRGKIVLVVGSPIRRVQVMHADSTTPDAAGGGELFVPYSGRLPRPRRALHGGGRALPRLVPQRHRASTGAPDWQPLGDHHGDHDHHDHGSRDQAARRMCRG
jgi:hypothetical protein